MIKREFKVNKRSFIIWLSILTIVFLVVYIIYPYIITDESVKGIEELINVFPEDVLKAFNMDLESITSAFGWLKTEGMTFVLLILGIYSSILGGNILLKEESDNTIEYLSCLPIKRSKIVTNKIIVSISLILSMVLIFGVFNYIALLISWEFNQSQFILLSIAPILAIIPIFSISLFISTFMHKTKGIMGISLGIVFISYILNVLSELSTKVSFIKYISVYTLADIRNVISKVSINPIMIIISLLISTIFIIGTYYRYNRKEML